MKGINMGAKKTRINPADVSELKNVMKQITGAFLGLL
jgi:hypothetical protein